jgi:hypothetical protein
VKAKEAMQYLKIDRIGENFTLSLVRKCPALKGGQGPGNGLNFANVIKVFENFLTAEKEYKKAKMQLTCWHELKYKKSKYSVEV